LADTDSAFGDESGRRLFAVNGTLRGNLELWAEIEAV